MSKLTESLETRLTRRVKGLYYNKPHQLGLMWHNEPFGAFNAEWFEECFRMAASEHGHRSLSHLTMLTKAQMGYHRWYGRLHDEALKRFLKSFQRLKDAQGPPLKQAQIVRETSFPRPVIPSPRTIAPSSPSSAIRARLNRLRETLAALPPVRS